MTDERTRVVFRKYFDGRVVALFPEEPYDQYGDRCVCYSHFGGYAGACIPQVIRSTDCPSPEDCADLYDELESLGYFLNVKQHCTPEMLRERKKKARQLAKEQGR